MIPSGVDAITGKSRRIPSLDGLRAVSILAVVLGHAYGTRGFPDVRGLYLLGDIGNLGVRVFFVISGLLITSLLLAEQERVGWISMKTFYLRRAFRIFPACYVYIGAISFLSTMGAVTVRKADLVFAATYTINFVADRSWVLGHLWSLAVEEQFYLLWPVILSLGGRRRAMIGATAVVVVSPLFRIAAWYLVPEHRGIITKAFPTIADAIAVGCVLAAIREQLPSWPPYRWLLQSRAFILVPVVLVVSNYFASHMRPDYLVGQTVRNITIAMCVDWSIRYPASYMGRLLNLRGMVFIGVLSYSLYLWQQLFLDRQSDGILASFPVNVAAAFTAAAASYFIVERPFLKLKEMMFPETRITRPSDDRPVSPGGSPLTGR